MRTLCTGLLLVTLWSVTSCQNAVRVGMSRSEVVRETGLPAETITSDEFKKLVDVQCARTPGITTVLIYPSSSTKALYVAIGRDDRVVCVQELIRFRSH